MGLQHTSLRGGTTKQSPDAIYNVGLCEKIASSPAARMP